MSLRFYDYRCDKCLRTAELLVETDSPHGSFPCRCGGIVSRVWVRGPLVGSPAKGRYPYYDVQLGKTFQSPDEKKRYLKDNGYIEISQEEHKRTLDNIHEPEEQYIDKDKWRDSAEKAWADMKSGNVPPDITTKSLQNAEADLIASNGD